MSDLNITKIVTANDGSRCVVSFIPSPGYKPQNSLHKAKGELIVYVDNEEVCEMDIDSVFIAIQELYLIDVENFHHAEMVIKGLLNYCKSYLHRLSLIKE